MEQLVLLPFNVFENLQNLLRDGVRHKVNRKAAVLQIEILQSRLESASETLSHRQKHISQIRHITQSKKDDWEFQYKQCRKHITGIEKHLGEIVTILSSRRARLFPTTVDDLLQITKEELEQLNGYIDVLNEIISSLHDGYVVVTEMVPENPSRILLDFDDPTSPEARLKKAIFDKNSETTTICAVASGMGGVGKTCALRAIGSHESVTERFPDGVLYMSLGSEATKDDLIQNLAKFVKCSGGEKESIEIENEKTLNDAIRTAAKWFQGRICLFLIDDIWCQKDIPRSVTQMLKKMVSHKHSRIAITTRDQDIDCDTSVPFEKREDSDAVKMLMHAADIRLQSPPKEVINATGSLIDISGGLPIALHAIGSRAKNLMKYRKGVDSNSVWTVVYEEYEKAKNDFPMIISNDEKNETVLNTLYLSVKMMGDGTAQDRTDTLFRSFCIIKKRQQVPTNILGRLWGISDAEATNQINKFERFSIVEVSRLSIGGHTGNCFVVHDLFLDVSKHLAEAEIGFVETVSKRLIYSYVTEEDLNSEKQAHTTSTAPSSSQAHATMQQRPSLLPISLFSELWISVSDDGFVLSNLFRILGIANMQAEGIALLRDPRWIAKQLKSCGWKQVDSDILIILQHIGGDAEYCSKTKEKTFLKMLRATVIECGQLIVNSSNAGVVWTELYGRLWYYKRYDIVSQFLNDIEKYATRPWYKSAGALPSPKASVQRVLRPGHRMKMLRDSGEEIEMYGIDIEEKCISLQVYYDDIDDLKERRRWTFPVRINSIAHWAVGDKCWKEDNALVVGFGRTVLVYHDSHAQTEGVDKNPIIQRYEAAIIKCVTVNRGGSLFVTGHENGNVNIWRFSGSAWTPTILERHTDVVSCVALSDAENHIASAYNDGTIRVRSLPLGLEMPSILEKDSGRVFCVSFKNDENCIVSGTGDGTVTVWSLVENVWNPVQLHSHTAIVTCVNVSESGRFIVSGSDDMTVRVWEEKSGTWKTRAIMNHNSYVVGVAINEKKKRVVSVCGDQTVAIHELGEENWATEEFDGHSSCVSYSVSNGGNQFATGAYDGKVQISEWTGHAWKSLMLDGPDGLVAEVAFSVDGRKLKAISYYSSDLVYYVKKGGEWTRADVEDDSKFEEGGDFELLRKQEWPHGLEKMEGWKAMWKLPSNYYGVFKDYKPNVSYVELIE